MFGNAKLNKQVAEEKLIEALTFFKSSEDYHYICGLCDMACELGVLSQEDSNACKERAARMMEKAIIAKYNG